MVILLLPSFLTLITLLVHRIRASRAAQRDRAPEDIVKNLPWRVWNGTRWEKADGTPHVDTLSKTAGAADSAPPGNLTPNAGSEGDEELDRVEQGSSRVHLPWYVTQVECAICLEEFAIGDKVRVLPCEHVFHMDEIDDWLINRKKLVSAALIPYFRPWRFSSCRIRSHESTTDAPFFGPVFSAQYVRWMLREIIQITNRRQRTKLLQALLLNWKRTHPGPHHHLGKLPRCCDNRTLPFLLATRGDLVDLLQIHGKLSEIYMDCWYDRMDDIWTALNSPS